MKHFRNFQDIFLVRLFFQKTQSKPVKIRKRHEAGEVTGKITQFLISEIKDSKTAGTRVVTLLSTTVNSGG